MEIEKLVRKNILNLQPYSCARDEYDGEQAVFLDANENPYDNGYNRYPDPYQRKLKEAIADLKGIGTECLLLGNGSDEIIDILIRSMCEPRTDNLIVFSPGYAMYEVSAVINEVGVRKINLTSAFLPDWEEMWKQVDGHTKLIFLCTPHNPTGKVIPYRQIETLCRQFTGLVVVDEAYIDFANERSAVTLLDKYPNVVVMQTLSKAWGMAGLRLGICMADNRLIRILNKVKAPYNVNCLTQEIAWKMIRQYSDFCRKLTTVKVERKRLTTALQTLKLFSRVYDSEANFVLVISKECRKLYDYLVARGIVVRLRDIPPLISGGIRITVGTREENDRLLETLENYRKQRL